MFGECISPAVKERVLLWEEDPALACGFLARKVRKGAFTCCGSDG